MQIKQQELNFKPNAEEHIAQLKMEADKLELISIMDELGPRKVAKILRPVECPICYQKVRVYGTDRENLLTEVIRTSSLDHCPRCKCGRLD
tara:strand:- start:123 stop:395 length:273 start_codon:yes stop_codon:yes gene_type:complete